MKKLKRTFVGVIALAALLTPLGAMAQEGDARSKARMDTVIGFAEDSLRYARYNVVGALYPNMLVDGWNVDTKEPAQWMYKGEVNYPSNITAQQQFLRTLVGLTNLTGDPKYREAAAEQVSIWFGETQDKFSDANGLIFGGEHGMVDVKTGRILSYNEHEMKQVFPYYEFMYEVEPEGIKRYMEACWNSHVMDWSNLSMNRHGYYNKPMSNMWDNEYTDSSIDFNNGPYLAFQNAGADLINFAFFISEKTGEDGPKLWGRRMLQKYIDTVNPVTGLSGAQYGELDSGDRRFLQFGPEFGEIAKEYNYIDKYKVKTIAGFAPQYLLPYVERTGDTEVLNYLVNSVEGVAKYVYDPEAHRLKTPMWSDGTTLMGYVLKRAGYSGVAGKAFSTAGQTTDPTVMHGAVQTYFASESDLIWQFVRDLAKNFGIGEIGTKPGENVSLNMESTSADAESVFTLLDLYKVTGHKDYLELAERIGETIIANYEKFRRGESEYAYTSVNRVDMVALLRIEAAVRGEWDAVDDGVIADAGIEFDFDGYGRTTEGAQLWSKKRTPATRVEIDGGDIVVAIDSARDAKFTDIEECAEADSIRALYSMGAINGVTEYTFAPERPITRAELISIAVKLCEFPHREKKFAIYPDVADDAWYRDAIETARNNGLIDEAMLKDGNLLPNEYITMEEMTSVIVKALKSINKDTEYIGHNAIKKLENIGEVSDWARDYVDIACNYLIITDTKLSPKKHATRAEAAQMLILLNNMIDKGYESVNATIYPSEATKKVVDWSSSDKSVFEVDENGRIYPVAEGSAVLTASADDIAETRNVYVIKKEDWMIKSVSLDGEDMQDFVPNKQEYDVNLLLGTKTFPKITAESYTGEKVIIEIPEEFPGKVTMYVAGYDKKYDFNFVAEQIDYKLDENFDGYQLDKSIQLMWSGDILWYSNSAGWAGGSSPIYVVKKPGGDEKDYCLKLDYNKGVNLSMGGRFPEKPYAVGATAKNNLIVLDFDVMTTAPIKNLYATMGDGIETPIRMYFTDAEIMAYTAEGPTEIGIYKPGEFTNIKIAVNAQTMQSDWYVNGELVLEDSEPLNTNPYETIARITFQLSDADAVYGAKAYFDNVKLYQLPEEFQERITESKK